MLRQQASLDLVLAPLVTRGVDSVDLRVLDALRLGTYQLQGLDRVPPHAAVDTTVALVREAHGARTGGFVNAVLRRVAELPRLEPGAAIHDLAAHFSHPEWLVSRWLARFGAAATEALLRYDNTPPPLVLQPIDGKLGDLEQLLADHGIPSTAAPWGAGVIVASQRPEFLPGYAAGAFFVQDPAQALVARFAAPAPDRVTFDACAAPGGKTMQLRASGRPVIAADRSRRRMARLRENLDRVGVQTPTVVADAMQPPIRRVATYLLDAPCLATGTLARHPDARSRITPPMLADLVERQRALLDAAADRVLPGGVLCYATCSLEPEENEMQVAAFLERHPEFRREPSHAVPPELITEHGDFATLPHRDQIDGAFASRLRRGDR